MAEAITFVTKKRDGRGSHVARKLRKQGLVPAVIYGHKEETLAVTVTAEELLHALRRGVRVLDISAEGKTEKALIREVQWDHLGKEVLHVDFARVSADERVTVTVPLQIRGTAPGVAQGGVLDQPLHTLEIECLALSMPESIRVNVGELQLNGVIHVKDLALPPDVKALADPETVVVHVTAKIVEEEAPVAAPAGAEAAEPEVIGRQKAAEEEEEEKK